MKNLIRLVAALALIATAATADDADEARKAGVDVETYRRCKGLIDALATEDAPGAVRELLDTRKESFRILLHRMDDRRPMGVKAIAIEAGPDAPEGILHYGPRQVVDCIALLLSEITGRSFGFLGNGASDRHRKRCVARWRDWYARTREYLYWNEKADRWSVNERARRAGIPGRKWEALPESKRAELLRDVCASYDRELGIEVRVPAGHEAAFLHALAKDPYRPAAFDAPPRVSDAVKRAALAGDQLVPALMHAWNRAFLGNGPDARTILEVLERMEGPASVAALERCIQDEHASTPLRAKAIEAYVSRRGADAFPVLKLVLDAETLDRDELAWAALRHAGKHGVTDAIPYLIRQLEEQVESPHLGMWDTTLRNLEVVTGRTVTRARSVEGRRQVVADWRRWWNSTRKAGTR